MRNQNFDTCRKAASFNNAIMHRPHAGWTNFPLLVCALTLTLAQTINKKFAAYGGRYMPSVNVAKS
jgi:hypothetical protein